MSLLIRRSAAPVSESMLSEVEEHLQVRLPADYREFLLGVNGGLPVNDRFSYRGRSGDKKAQLLHLYGVGRDGLVDASALDLVSANGDRPSGLRNGCLFIGEVETAMNYGKVVIACSGDDAGHVFYRPNVEDEKSTLYPVAESFTAFLESLRHESRKGPKLWQLAIYRGDVDALKEALSGSKKSWIEDAAHLAVEDGQWEILKHLMEVAEKKHGVTPAWAFGQALSEHRYGLVKRVLTEFEVPRKAVADCLAGTEGWLWLDIDLVRLILDKGGEVDTDPDSGPSPLHCAVSSTNAEAVALLIGKGADPTTIDEDGRTPRELAHRLEELKIALMLRDYEAEWQQRQPTDRGPEAKPFDLCGITFARTGKPITMEEIVAFEKETALTLPPEYRWLLLQANGAILSANLIRNIAREDDDFDDDEEPDGDLDGSDLDGSDLDGSDMDEEEMEASDEDEDEDEGEREESYVRVTFFPLRQQDCVDEYSYEEDMPPALYQSAAEARGWYHDGSEIPKGTLPIAELHGYGYEGTGFLLIGCHKKSLGQLFAFDHTKQRLELTLPTLFAELGRIAKQPKPAVDRLADAIAARDIAGVKSALADDRAMPWSTRDGRMPVRMMLEANYDEAIEAYIESGNDLHLLMSDAMNFDRCDVIKECFRRTKKVKQDVLGMLRQLPSVYRDKELLALMQAAGVKFNKSGRFETPLAHVAAASNSLGALQFALDQGADVHAVEKETGRTALIAACDSDYGDPVAMVTKLLDLGVRPVQWTCEGHTALHFAVSHGYGEAAKKLIDAGESMFQKYECYAEGMSIAQSRKMMERGMQRMEKLFGELGDQLDDQDDRPPLPDTSTPEGEKAAELMEVMAKAQEKISDVMGNLADKMQRQRAEGLVGEAANAQRHFRNPEAAAKIIASLEDYERSRRRV